MPWRRAGWGDCSERGMHRWVDEEEAFLRLGPGGWWWMVVLDGSG